MLRCFGQRYAFLGLFTLLEECLFRIAQPLFMGETDILCDEYFVFDIYGVLETGCMMEYFREDSNMTEREAFGFASGVVLCSAVYTFLHHPYTFCLQHTGMKMRVAASSLLYR